MWTEIASFIIGVIVALFVVTWYCALDDLEI